MTDQRVGVALAAHYAAREPRPLDQQAYEPPVSALPQLNLALRTIDAAQKAPSRIATETGGAYLLKEGLSQFAKPDVEDAFVTGFDTAARLLLGELSARVFGLGISMIDALDQLRDEYEVPA